VGLLWALKLSRTDRVIRAVDITPELAEKCQFLPTIMNARFSPSFARPGLPQSVVLLHMYLNPPLLHGMRHAAGRLNSVEMQECKSNATSQEI
jgi:hypothetical protein